MDTNEILGMAKSIINEAFYTIMVGIVPSSGDKQDKELTLYEYCGEILTAIYIDSAKGNKPMTISDAIEVCNTVGKILSHTYKEKEE